MHRQALPAYLQGLSKVAAKPAILSSLFNVILSRAKNLSYEGETLRSAQSLH